LLGHAGGVPEDVGKDAGVPELVPLRGFNPGGIVYGVLAIATVIAAEGTRQETFAKLLLASIVTMGLYWAAHAYSHHWGERLHGAGQWTLKQIALSLRFEMSILFGAAVPVAVLLLAWAAGASLEAGVTAVLWTAAIEIVALEAVPSIRNHLGPKDLLVQTVFGITLGIGILGLRLVLH
jgi:hypothetical protein